MNDHSSRHSTSSHASGCLLCGRELTYTPDAATVTCALCGATTTSTARCAAGHFVCDTCHGAGAAEVIERTCLGATGTDPIALSVELMRSPTFHMHGPEHHFLVPAVLLATYDNARGQPELKPAHLCEARRRAEAVPGGFCGTHGSCGAGVGTGIFWSIASGATPLSVATWSQSNAMTAQSLVRIAAHGGPRCCKRDSFHAILEAVAQVARLTGLTLPCSTPLCEHSRRNKQCLGSACLFWRA